MWGTVVSVSLARCSIFVVGLLAFCSLLFSQRGWSEPRSSRITPRIDRMNLDGVDLGPLQLAARNCKPDLAEEELRHLVEANFRFVFFNQLNESRFLVPPPAEKVVQRIVSILAANEKLREIIEKGRELAAHRGSKRQLRALVREIGDTAKQLNQEFVQYFVEVREAKYSIHLPSEGDISSTFVHYLVQSERIQRELTAELERYFFNPVPGSVHLSDYDGGSITVLSESLVRLSKLTLQRL